MRSASSYASYWVAARKLVVTVLIAVAGFGAGILGGRLYVYPQLAAPLVVRSPPVERRVATPIPAASWRTASAPGMVYPCADPANICDHFVEIGCTYGRLPACYDATRRLGEDVCLKLYDAKSGPEVVRLGSKCSP